MLTIHIVATWVVAFIISQIIPFFSDRKTDPFHRG
jgi:hypothetical protein